MLSSKCRLFCSSLNVLKLGSWEITMIRTLAVFHCKILEYLMTNDNNEGHDYNDDNDDGEDNDEGVLIMRSPQFFTCFITDSFVLSPSKRYKTLCADKARNKAQQNTTRRETCG